MIDDDISTEWPWTLDSNLGENNLKLQELQNTLTCINSLVRDLNNLN